MKKKLNFMIAPLLVIALFGTITKSEVVAINSGVDSITFLRASGDRFDHVFTDADFSSARTGQYAFVVQPVLDYIPNNSTSPTALWINCVDTAWIGYDVHPYASALYAIPFELMETGNVTLDFYYAIDNGLGDSINSGLFVNGFAISGTNSDNPIPIEYSSVHSLSKDITQYVVQGLNYLYVYQCDWGVAAGSQFTAVITPEPTTLLLLGLGGLAVMRKGRA